MGGGGGGSGGAIALPGADSLCGEGVSILGFGEGLVTLLSDFSAITTPFHHEVPFVMLTTLYDPSRASPAMNNMILRMLMPKTNFVRVFFAGALVSVRWLIRILTCFL